MQLLSKIKRFEHERREDNAENLRLNLELESLTFGEIVAVD